MLITRGTIKRKTVLALASLQSEGEDNIQNETGDGGIHRTAGGASGVEARQGSRYKVVSSESPHSAGKSLVLCPAPRGERRLKGDASKQHGNDAVISGRHLVLWSGNRQSSRCMVPQGPQC